mgnify:CR=1 FL=1
MSNEKNHDEGIPISGCFHRQCGEKQLIDYGGYVWCEHCNEIVRDEDILDVEEKKGPEVF